MEILFVTHKYPPVIGGMEKQSFELISGMKKHAKVHTIVYEGKESRITFFRLLHRRIRQICREHPGISLIHFNDGLIAAFSLMHYGYRHLKRSVTLHGLDVVYPNMIYQQLILPKFNRFDQIIAVSSATATACTLRGIMRDKISVINNGVDTQTRPQLLRTEVDLLLQKKYEADSKNRRILVAIGRPVKRKGFSWFITNVVPLLHEDFLLLLIGPVSTSNTLKLLGILPAFLTKPIALLFGLPEDEHAINQLLDSPHTAGKVIRLGRLPGADINHILGIADAFVMPNIEVAGDMEGFGLVCLEAAMCGTRVIAAASGGIPDAIQQAKNGQLLPPGNSIIWANTINNLAEIDLPAAAAIIDYTTRQYSWEKMTEKYYQEFMKITG